MQDTCKMLGRSAVKKMAASYLTHSAGHIPTEWNATYPYLLEWVKQ